MGFIVSNRNENGISKESMLTFNPMVSIIVLAYNQEKTISQTLDSILVQKCSFNYEIIIGDDFSTDNTRAICIQYQKVYPRIIKTVFHDNNNGVAINFVLSVRQAIGEFISICAADDFWNNENKLQIQVDFFSHNPEYGLIYTDYDRLNIINGKITKNYIKKTKIKIIEGQGLMKYIFNGMVPIAAHTVMFRRVLFDKYVPVEDYIKYRFPLEDWPTWLILSKYTKIGYLDISTGTYRYGHESISYTMNYNRMENRFSKEKIMYKYLCNRFPEDLSYNEAEYNRYIKNVLLNLAYKKSDYKAAKIFSQEIKELGSGNIKSIFATNYLSFKFLTLLKKIRNHLLN